MLPRPNDLVPRSCAATQRVKSKPRNDTQETFVTAAAEIGRVNVSVAKRMALDSKKTAPSRD
jgi:hypothetical protein